MRQKTEARGFELGTSVAFIGDFSFDPCDVDIKIREYFFLFVLLRIRRDSRKDHGGRQKKCRGSLCLLGPSTSIDLRTAALAATSS